MDERYQIGKEIGKGGGGLVYRGYDTFLKRDVAIKRILDTENATDDEIKSAARNLLGEAQTLSTLNHPNIVTVFDVGMDEKGGFVVMELLDGETLYDTVDRGVLTQEDFVELAIQTMEALIAAHAVNVMHRDLKPTNVMVIWQPSGRFQTKILDFGLAKFSKKPSVQTLNQDGTVMGSILFMAPEQFERQELDERTDLYSMGCVYYHSLCGQYPYDGETSADVMNAHLEHRVTPLEILRPDLAPSICQWVMWMINRDIDNRPDSARAALELLPRHPELAKEQELQDVPVEKTGKVKLVQVKPVKAPVQGANVPKNLVVMSGAKTEVLSKGAATTTILKKGAKTTLMTQGATTTMLAKDATGPLRGATGSPGTREKLYNKQKMSTSDGMFVKVLIGLVLVAVGFFAVKAIDEHRKKTRLNMISRQKILVPDPKTIDLLVGFIYSKKSTLQQKMVAGDALRRMQGDQVNGLILKRIQTEAPSATARMTLCRILGDRKKEAAVPDLLEAHKSAQSKGERKSILDLAKSLVEAAQMRDPEPDLLGNVPDPKAREQLLKMYLEKISSMRTL